MYESSSFLLRRPQTFDKISISHLQLLDILDSNLLELEIPDRSLRFLIEILDSKLEILNCKSEFGKVLEKVEA